MNKPKWYHRLLIALTVIVFSPLIIAGIIIAGVYTLFQMPKNRREYKRSRYYADFQRKYRTSILYSPEYRFYNSAIRRNLPIKYVKQDSNGFEYFICNETVYLFPDFEQIDYFEDKECWQVDYDGDWKPFDESYAHLLSELEIAPDYPVKLLVERQMFPMLNLNGREIPDCIFITRKYENAFDNEESPLKMIVPQNTEELFEMMLQTPDLCGVFELAENKERIVWNLHENIRIELWIDPRDCYFGISRLLFGNNECEIAHWHPSVFEIYDDVCDIGKRGNVLVFRSAASSGTLMYSGSKANCPYSPNKKLIFGQYFYLEAK